MNLQGKGEVSAFSEQKDIGVAGLEFRVDTFFWHLELAALSDLDCLHWLVSCALFAVLYLLNYVIALENLSENDVAAVQPRCDDCGDEKLAAVSIFARVGHA
jgi:hypothetical protein